MYARVSTEHEAQINALENQLEWYKIEYSRHSDWEIVEVYVDQGITGTQAQKRPEFLRVMEDLDGKAHRKRPAPGAGCPRNFAACQQLHGRTWKGNL